MLATFRFCARYYIVCFSISVQTAAHWAYSINHVGGTGHIASHDSEFGGVHVGVGGSDPELQQ